MQFVAFRLGYKGETNDRGQCVDSRPTDYLQRRPLSIKQLISLASSRKEDPSVFLGILITFKHRLFRLRDFTSERISWKRKFLWFFSRLIMLTTVDSLLQSGTRFLFCRRERLSVVVALNTVISWVFFSMDTAFPMVSDKFRCSTWNAMFRRNEEEWKGKERSETPGDAYRFYLASLIIPIGQLSARR